MLTDWVRGSAITYTKNPDYWAFDEKFPENRLPYLDQIKILVIPDQSTRLAALRTGKLTRLGGFTPDQAKALQKSNPELILSTYVTKPRSYAMDVRTPPFDDIRVRRAMQLALDNDVFNEGLYDGLGDTTPFGIVGPAAVGFYIPYEEWPEDVKQNFVYDPERAKALLAEAGYPNGFKTTLELASTWTGYVDLDHAQVAKEMWAEIGVEVEIDIVEQAVFLARTFAHEYQGMTWGNMATNYNPLFFIKIMAGSNEEWNTSGAQDPVFDDMVEAANNAGSREEMMELVAEADFYATKQHWNTVGPQRPAFYFYVPWLVGYNGELTVGGGRTSMFMSRVWIDSDLRYELTGER
jgi:peptide/nickel transport system substrate-binding protein